MIRRRSVMLGVVLALGGTADRAAAQGEVPLRDLVVLERDVPVRLAGYGIVVGLDGSGDRALGGVGGGHTVRSVANLLRRFDVHVPPEALRTRNVAAVLVTAEISPYLRPGGRFDLQVASMGDATSLRGGVLWMTPLIADIGGEPVATGQGPLLISDGASGTFERTVETSARIPEGGLLEVDPAVPAFAASDRLSLREPGLATAARIAEAIDAELGAGSATVEDPGSVRLSLPEGQDRAATLARIQTLLVVPDRPPRVVIDGRDGTVVAGGAIRIGSAVVSHGGLTISIDGTPAAGPGGPGEVRVPEGATIQDVAAALNAVGAPPAAVAAVFEALRRVGAISADLIVR